MSDHWASGLEAWAQAHAAWGAAATFLVAFLESFPVVSLLVPSTALLLGLGALVGSGMLEPGPVLLACVAGGVLGDAAGYWLARAIGPRAIRRWMPASCRRPYARAVLAFRRWGWWAVFIGRFLGPVRAVAPLAAGVTGMREAAFQSANILSAMLWAPLMLMPGSLGAWLARQIGPEPLPILATALGALLLWLGWQRLRPVLTSALRTRPPR